MMKLYMGSLPSSIDDAGLKELVAPFGAAESAVVVRDRDTGASRGFGFVEFNSADEANAAIAGLNGKEVDGKSIVVNEARPSKGRN
jgi:cold-inducible RNA-binding protein